MLVEEFGSGVVGFGQSVASAIVDLVVGEKGRSSGRGEGERLGLGWSEGMALLLWWWWWWWWTEGLLVIYRRKRAGVRWWWWWWWWMWLRKVVALVVVVVVVMMRKSRGFGEVRTRRSDRSVP